MGRGGVGGGGGLPHLHMDISHKFFISVGRVGALSYMYISHNFFIGMLHCFSLKTGIDFAYFGLKLGMVF